MFGYGPYSSYNRLRGFVLLLLVRITRALVRTLILEPLYPQLLSFTPISYPTHSPLVTQWPSVAEMGSFGEKSDGKLAHVSFATDQLDTGAPLLAGVSLPLDPEESVRIRYGPIRWSTGMVSSML